MRWEEYCMKRVVLIGCALLLAMTASASARLGIAPLAAQDDAVIQVRGGHGHGHGHHAGPWWPWSSLRMGPRPRTPLRLAPSSPLLNQLRSPGRCFRRSIAPMNATTGGMDGRADRRGLFSWPVDAAQPSPISTAIRIRSEWFLAPSFCFSSEVVLATVL